MLVCRQSIIAEVENSLAAQYAAMPQEELHQWHATLQQGLSESSDAHHKAKDYLKQVGKSQLVTHVLKLLPIYWVVTPVLAIQGV